MAAFPAYRQRDMRDCTMHILGFLLFKIIAGHMQSTDLTVSSTASFEGKNPWKTVHVRGAFSFSSDHRWSQVKLCIADYSGSRKREQQESADRSLTSLRMSRLMISNVFSFMPELWISVLYSDTVQECCLFSLLIPVECSDVIFSCTQQKPVHTA